MIKLEVEEEAEEEEKDEEEEEVEEDKILYLVHRINTKDHFKVSWINRKTRRDFKSLNLSQSNKCLKKRKVL